MENDLTFDDGILVPCWLHDGKLMQIILTDKQREMLKSIIGGLESPVKVAKEPICYAEVLSHE